MRKRINSEEKYSYADVRTVALALTTEQISAKQKISKHPPRPSKKSQTSKCSLSYLSKAICTQKIRQFPNPLLKELRRLVINQIDSGDRLFRSLITQEHKAALQLYSEDRIKLIDYLNSLAIRQVNIDNIKLDLQRKKQSKERKIGLQDEEKIQTLDLSAEVNETVRKRCKSEIPKDAKFDGELKNLKKKLKKMEKDWNEINHLKLKSKEKMEENVEPKENILLQVKEILESALDKSVLKENFILMQKIEIEAIIYLLSQALNRNQEMNIMHRKQLEQLDGQLNQKQEIIIQLKRQLDQKTNELYFFQRQCKSLHSLNYEQLKQKVNYLHNQLSVLVNDIQNKDELIEYIKGENNELKNDIEGLEAMNKSAKKQQQMITDYLQNMEQRLRYSQDLNNQHEMQLNQLRVELLHKDIQLTTKLKQMRSILGSKQIHQEELTKKIQILQKKLLNCCQQKNLLKLQKEYLKNQVQNLELKLRNIQEECRSYTKHAHSNDNFELTFQNRKEFIESNPQENNVINKIQNIVSQEPHNVIYQSKEIISIQDYQVAEQDEPSTPLKVVKNLSMEVNQSYFPLNDHQIDFGEFNLENPFKLRTMSLNQDKIFIVQNLERHRDTENYQTKRNSSSKKKARGPLTEVVDVHHSDDQKSPTQSQNADQQIYRLSYSSKEPSHNNQGEQQKQIQSVQQLEKRNNGQDKLSKDLLQIEQVEEKKQGKIENEITIQKNNLTQQNKVIANQHNLLPQQYQEEPKKNSFVLIQQNQQESSAKVSEAQSKVSQSSSRTIFIKWGAKKNIGLLQRNERVKSCTS